MTAFNKRHKPKHSISGYVMCEVLIYFFYSTISFERKYQKMLKKPSIERIEKLSQEARRIKKR